MCNFLNKGPKILKLIVRVRIYYIFLPVSQRVEINYIFSDNIRILYLSWYVKSPKETVKLSEKSRNKRRSYRFLLCPL